MSRHGTPTCPWWFTAMPLLNRVGPGLVPIMCIAGVRCCWSIRTKARSSHCRRDDPRMPCQLSSLNNSEATGYYRPEPDASRALILEGAMPSTGRRKETQRDDTYTTYCTSRDSRQSNE